MAGALTYATAARIATRELRSSRTRFLFVVLSVAIGVAALTGVRGFSASFRRELLLRARSIMAADLSARAVAEPTADEQRRLNALSDEQGMEQTQVTELLSMASAVSSMEPMLVAVKGIDPGAYPFYGQVKLSPAMPLRDAVNDSNVAVGDDLLLRLHLRVGDAIRLGEATFRISATVVDEPDRLSGMFAAGPRVLVSLQALQKTGLLAPGARLSRRYLFRITPRGGQAASDEDVARRKAELEAALPEAQVQDYREANPAVTRALDGATGLLSLMSLVALVLGAIGVAMAMRTHLQQRMEAIAIMKSLGASSGQVLKIYVLQTLLLGLSGGVAGALLGLAVQTALPLFVERLLHVSPGFRLDAHAVALGISAGLVTTLLFTLPPLLDIRGVRPILILRRQVETSEDPFLSRMGRKLRDSGAQLAATLLLLGGLAALAWTVSDSRRIGGYFALGLGAVLLVLLATSALVLWLLRVFLRGTRQSLPSSVRHGLANLYRPGNPSAALLAALGLGVMQIGTVYMVQRAIVREMQISTAANLPNLFLLDISAAEVGQLRTLLKAQPQVKGEPELVPVVSSRVLAIDGVKARDLRVQRMPRRVLQSIQLTWEAETATPPPGDKVVSGHWWSASQAKAADRVPLVAVEKTLADRLGIHAGSHVTFAAQDEEIDATVAALFRADAQHAFSRAQFVMPQATLAGLPVIWYGGVHCDPDATAVLRRVLYEHYPTVTVIDVAATVETVRQVILQITYVIQFLAGFSIFAGVVILASAIAGTRYRRIREVVVLKTLGATRPRIATIFSVEFAVLGLVAGLVGLLFANVLARVLLVRALKFDYTFQPGLNVAAWLTVALLAVLAGWAASFRVLGQKPLEVLREE